MPIGSSKSGGSIGVFVVGVRMQDPPPNTCHFCGQAPEQVGTLIEGGPADHKICLCAGCLASSARTLENQRRLSLPKEARLKKIPTPKQIVAHLDGHVIGQDAAKRKLAVAVGSHYLRLEANSDDGVAIGKSNVLLLGPSGSGKTHLVKSLAGMLNVPFAVGDANSLTEAGYVGEDVESLLHKLLVASSFDVDAARRGIVFIDEIDKIEGGRAHGAKDMRLGVQHALLKMIEGTICNVPPGGGIKHPAGEFISLDTTDILFICGGAFVGLESIISRRLGRGGFGFDTSGQSVEETNLLRHVMPCDLEAFGLIPELLGRLPVIAPLEELSSEALAHILTQPHDALLKQYQKLVALRGADLEFTPGAVLEIARVACERGIGARGLRSVVEGVLFDVTPGDLYTVTEEAVRGGGVQQRRKPPIAVRRVGLRRMMPTIPHAV